MPKRSSSFIDRPSDPEAVRSGSSAAPRHENRVLAGLPPSDLALLAPLLQAVTLDPGAGQRHELPLDYVYFPHHGLVTLLATTPNGETIEMASAGRAGAVCSFLQSDPRDGMLVAQGALRASRIAVGRLQAILGESETLGRAVAACREALLLQLRHNLVCAGLHAVEQRLPRWLLEAADRTAAHVIPVTQDSVAQRLGVRRTTITLLAGKLQEMGAVRWSRSRVEILDRARLERVACSCYAVLRERIGSLLPSI